LFHIAVTTAEAVYSLKWKRMKIMYGEMEMIWEEAMKVYFTVPS
jgi:hypothetical protein